MGIYLFYLLSNNAKEPVQEERSETVNRRKVIVII